MNKEDRKNKSPIEDGHSCVKSSSVEHKDEGYYENELCNTELKKFYKKLNMSALVYFIVGILVSVFYLGKYGCFLIYCELAKMFVPSIEGT